MFICMLIMGIRLRWETLVAKLNFQISRVKIIYIYIYVSRLNSTIGFTRKTNTVTLHLLHTNANFSSRRRLLESPSQSYLEFNV